MTPRLVYPAGGLTVELDDSNCVVIRRSAIQSANDVVVTVTDVRALTVGLHACHELQRLVDAGKEGPAPWPRDGVYRIEPGRWMIPSGTHLGAYWMVEEGSGGKGRYWSCTCPAGKKRGPMNGSGRGYELPCRHVVASQRAEVKDAIPPRPSGRPNPSALVD